MEPKTPNKRTLIYANTKYKKRCEAVCKSFHFELVESRGDKNGCLYLIGKCSTVFVMEHHILLLLERMYRQNGSIYNHPEAKKYSINYQCDCGQPSCPYGCA